MNKLIAVTLFASLGLKLSCSPETSEPVMDPVTRVLDEQLVSKRTPAVQYVFFSTDSVLYRYDNGRADLARQVPVSRATTYNSFSVTKTFTALAVLQLVEEGKIDLDEPAAVYIPAFPYSSDITVRHLLTHSAGISNPIPLSWIHLKEEHPAFDSKAFFRRISERHDKIKGKPNDRFAYSNLGYVLLGEVIENVSGMDYEEYVMRNIIEPIGLSQDELGFSINDATLARGYHRQRSVSYWMLGFLLDKQKHMDYGQDGWRAFQPYYVNGAAYGGLIGTVDGFVRYAQALLDPSTNLISDEYKQLLFTENVLNSGKASGMCLSWFKGELGGNAYYSHAGGGGGYYTEVRLYPELGRGSVIMFNRSGMRDQRFLDRVDRHFLQSTGEGGVVHQYETLRSPSSIASKEFQAIAIDRP